MKKNLPDFRRIKQQRGYLLLALLLVVVLAGSSFVLGTFGNRQTAFVESQKEIHRQMEIAKSNLLAYAANSATLYADARGPGFFPCPDANNDGQPETTCNCPDSNADGVFDTTCTSDAPIIGRLPEYQDFSGKNFDFNDYYSGLDQQFWLVVGPRYIYHSSTTSKRRSNARTYSKSPSNYNSTASSYWLNLDGTTKYVALIVAPGEALDTQDRSTNPLSYSEYLDGQNGSNGFNFYSTYTSDPSAFNDQILGITLDEYMVAVGTAVATRIKTYLDQYRVSNGSYPPDNGGSSDYNPSSSCSSTTYSNWFDSKPTWLRDTSNSTSGERWSCRYGTYWDRSTSNTSSGTLIFNGCPGIVFTLTYGSPLTRSGRSC